MTGSPDIPCCEGYDYRSASTPVGTAAGSVSGMPCSGSGSACKGPLEGTLVGVKMATGAARPSPMADIARADPAASPMADVARSDSAASPMADVARSDSTASPMADGNRPESTAHVSPPMADVTGVAFFLAPPCDMAPQAPGFFLICFTRLAHAFLDQFFSSQAFCNSCRKASNWPAPHCTR